MKLADLIMNRADDDKNLICIGGPINKSFRHPKIYRFLFYEDFYDFFERKSAKVYCFCALITL